MANRFRGEVDVKGTSDTTYVVRFGSRALCQLMDQYDEPTDAALFTRLAKELSPDGQRGVNQRVLRRVLLACLEPPITDESEADAILDDCGEAAVIDAFVACVEGRQGVKGNPQTPTRRKRTPSGTTSSTPPPQ